MRNGHQNDWPMSPLACGRPLPFSRLIRPHAAGSERERDAQFALEAYAEGLADYPRDAILTALQAWPRKHKWWPAFAELVALIEPLCERRRMLTEAINAQRT